MEAFLAALEKLDDVTPDSAFRQLFQFFESINRQDRDSIIALYQAFTTFRERVDPDRDSDELDKVKFAIIGRMYVLCNELSSQQAHNLALIFSRAADVHIDLLRG